MLPQRQIFPQPRPNRLDGIEVAAVRREPHLDETVFLVCCWSQQEPFVSARSPDDPTRHRDGVRTIPSRSRTSSSRSLRISTSPVTIPSRSHRIPSRSMQNPFAIPHHGILRGYDPRMIPHTNLSKWTRFPNDPTRSRDGVRTIPSRSRTSSSRSLRVSTSPVTIPARSHGIPSRSMQNPFGIPHHGILRGCDFRMIPHTNLSKWARSPDDPS